MKGLTISALHDPSCNGARTRLQRLRFPHSADKMLHRGELDGASAVRCRRPTRPALGTRQPAERHRLCQLDDIKGICIKAMTIDAC